jgi:hypothetical protein
VTPPRDDSSATLPWQAALTRGRDLLAARRLDDSAAAFDLARRLGCPDHEAVEDQWRCAMLRGRLDEAWRLSDGVLARRRLEDFNRPWTPYHTRCVWRGGPLTGRRVLIRCYHGLGDTLQFVRYAAPLAARASTVFVEAQPELLALIRTMPAVAAAVPLGEGDRLAVDADVESMELPHALRTGLAAIPAAVPYLLAPGGPAPGAPGPGLAVGLVWSGGDWDPRRSIPPALLAPLFGVRGITVQSLQLGGAAALPGPCRDWSSPDVAALAARMQALDLVVTIDTMAAHLAGALARPVWTLLHADADWRWLGLGRRSPWYPTMRLYRQKEPGDWTSPIGEAARDLERLVHLRSSGWSESPSVALLRQPPSPAAAVAARVGSADDGKAGGS